MDSERYEALIKDFGEKVEADAIEVDQDGRCGLVFDDEIVLHIQNDPDREAIKLFASPGFVREPAAAEAASHLLAANRFWTGTGGATLGWDPENREVQLAYAIPAEQLDTERFARVLELFLHNLEDWRARLAEWNRGDFAIGPRPADAAPAATPGDEMMKV